MTVPFEAVVFRYMPDEGSGEFLNLGLAMRTSDGRFFEVKLTEGWTRITSAFPSAHVPTIKALFGQIRSALDGRATGQRVTPETDLHAELRHLLGSADGAIQLSERSWGSPTTPRRRSIGSYVATSSSTCSLP